MKVLLINGSPHENGCTDAALKVLSEEFFKQGIGTDMMHIGRTVCGCMACGQCADIGKCIMEDRVNDALAKARHADGFVFGSPVYYASPNGSMVAFMDRFFKAGNITHKPAAVLATARRGGNVAALDVLLKYPQYRQMPIVTADYWPVIYGSKPEEILADKEGIYTMQRLAKNMAWLMKCIEKGKEEGIYPDCSEKNVWTAFYK